MNLQEQHRLRAEKTFLQGHLAALPENARLTRMSVKARLRAVDGELEGLAAQLREPAKVRLTFQGRPVLGSHGIFADFGMKAVSGFSEAVSTVAASLSATLASKGPVPNRDRYRLMITGAAVGSFGFELEEPENDQLPFGELSTVGFAIERTQSLLKSTFGTDEELADSAAETDRRAVDSVRAFLQTLAENDAVCTTQSLRSTVRFADTGQVRKSLARLSQDNFHASYETVQGELQGVLPKSRTFEFRDLSTGEVIRGKVGVTIPDADVLNQHLHEELSLRLWVTRIGAGRPRYVLEELPGW